MPKHIKTSLIFTILSLTASVFNFLFYPVISHLLSVTDFGDIQIGISFIMVAAALFTSLNTLALFLSAQKKASSKSSLLHIERLATTASLVLAILVIVLASPLQSFLNLGDKTLLYILAVVFIVNIPASTWVGVLQGNGQFIASGWVGLAASLAKILFSVIFIMLGWGAHGALIGMLFGFLIILPLVKILQNRPLVSFRSSLRLIGKVDLDYFRKDKTSLYILISMVAVAVVVNLDVTIAKVYLDPSAAGAYAQISTAAKIPYFGLVPIAIVLFRGFIDTPYSIRNSVFSFLGITAVAGIATYLLKDFVLGTVFGSQDTLNIFGFLIISFVSYSILMLCMYALIARQMIKHILAASLISIAIVTVTLTLNHSSAHAIAQSFAISVSLATVMYISLLYRRRRL